MSIRLETKELGHAFGGLVVASDINLTIEQGARTALIGPNGAGKTTFVNLVSGHIAPSSGEVVLDGDSITSLSEHERVRRGLVRTFQVSRLFRDLSVADNLRLAILQRKRLSKTFTRAADSSSEIEQELDDLLAKLFLAHRRNVLVQKLAYGEQRLLEILLALALQPRVLLLDEPAAGVPQAEVSAVLDVIAALPSDLAILLIEHDMDVVFRFAREIVVLVAGKVFAKGSPEFIAKDPRVREIYFGRKAHGRNRH